LVAPVLTKGGTSVNVHFPGEQQYWYDHWTHERLEKSGSHNVAAPYDKVPVFQRGGSIVPKRERIRRSSALMHNDPITLVVAPDRQGMAKGTLYLDDGKSFDYKQGSKLYMEITYDNGRLESKMIEAGMETPVWLEKVLILGAKPGSGPAQVSSSAGEANVDTRFEFSTRVMTIRKPGVNMGKSWVIKHE
jgi:alpha 1,3-glucosidase